MNRRTVLETVKDIKSGKIRIKDLIQECIENIEKKDNTYNAFISLNKENALDRAEKLQTRLDAGEDIGILGGIPVAIKDNILVEGLKTTCGSKMLENYMAPYSATVINKLEENGAIIIGKTNMDEFAMGSTTKTSYYGETKNPVNIEYIPGGSSGGSATAIGTDMCMVSLGSDTGGSVRQPAAFCGLVGLKPTYGMVSRYGLVAYASSFDQIGPMGKTVQDVALTLQVIMGCDSKDSTSQFNLEKDYLSTLSKGVKGLKVGIPREFFTEDLEDSIKESVINAAKVLEDNGAIVEEINVGNTEYAVMAYYIIACAQASSNLARFDGVKYGYRSMNYESLGEMYDNTWKEGFGEEVRKRISLGEYVLSSGFYEEHYLKALKVRRLIWEEYEKHFEKYDLILSPVTKVSGIKLSDDVDSIKLYMDDLYTVSANLCGYPAISVPFGKNECGLPIGVQIMGKSFSEETILRAAFLLEQRNGD